MAEDLVSLTEVGVSLRLTLKDNALHDLTFNNFPVSKCVRAIPDLASSFVLPFYSQKCTFRRFGRESR